MYERRGVLSSHSVACTTNFCTRDFSKKKNCECTIDDLAIGDLAIGFFGVHAIESLDVRVRVAANVVKTMKRKKIARNRSSTFDSSIQILLAILRRAVFALFSLSSEIRNSVVLVLVEDLRELA